MKKLIYLIIFSLSIWGCEKIVAEDITQKTPVVIVPTVNDTINQNPVYFKWEEMEGATKYHLEVVSPSFANISQFALDTVVSDIDFSFSLDSNQYEMRLTASNGAYNSYTSNNLKFWVGVQPTQSSSVTLVSPLDGVYFNSSFGNQFSWNSLANASSYDIQIRSGSSFEFGTYFGGTNGIGTTNYVETNTFSEGEYHWGVMAYLNSGSQTNFSTRVFYIDDTAPNQASLTTPVDQTFISAGVISFSWSNGSDPGVINAPVNSTIEISSDTNFTNIVQTETVQSETTDITISTSGIYYWRITNVDDAGNSAIASNVYQFTVIP